MTSRTQETGRPELSDEELDTFILARLTMLGVDLSVLPEDDAEAPADQRRILASARRFLRTTPPALVDFVIDPQAAAPVFYPAAAGVPRGAGDNGDPADG